MKKEERFKSKLAPKDPPTGCIEYSGYRDKDGYGRIQIERSSALAHRVAWALKHGPIPEGMKVCHTCDNPPCCNDEHLFLGTSADNSADMASKGRAAKGEGHGKAKLSAKDVVKIKGLLSSGETLAKIASKYNVSFGAIHKIKSGRNWAHA